MITGEKIYAQGVEPYNTCDAYYASGEMVFLPAAPERLARGGPKPLPTSERVARFWSKVARNGACHEWQASCLPNGYGQVHLGRDRDGRLVHDYAHRVAYRLTHGPIPDGLVVMHTCDNRRCVNPAHLRAATQAENLQDCRDKGRQPRERVGGWTIDPALRRRLVAEALTAPHGAVTRLARQHRVSVGLLSAAVRRARQVATHG